MVTTFKALSSISDGSGIDMHIHCMKSYNTHRPKQKKKKNQTKEEEERKHACFACLRVIISWI